MLDTPGKHLIDVRNRALLAVAYDTRLRRSELVSLKVADVLVEADGSATLLLGRSKRDSEGRGRTLFLAGDSVGFVCEWLCHSGVKDGFLFRSLQKNGKVGRKLDASQVPRIYKAMARRAGLATENSRRNFGAQHARWPGSGHDCPWHRRARNPAGRAVAEHCHGATLWRTPVGEKKRLCAMGQATASALVVATQ